MVHSIRKQTRLDTKQRRTNQSCKVYSLKVVKSKLSKKTKAQLNSIFLEGKWLYNHILSEGDPFGFNTKVKEVDVLVKDHTEVRALTNISAQMKQGIQGRMVLNIQNLAKAKKAGRKVGRLKYRSRLSCIPLKQYGYTHKIEGKSYIKLQGVKQKLKVNGLDQIPKGVEYANANLVKVAEDYFINLTTFQDKVETIVPDQAIGIDFGCQTQLTLSNGTKIEFQVPVSKRIKRLDRKIMRKNRPYSKNKVKDQLKREKAYNKVVNKKTDIRNKIVSALTKNFRTICFQDESIHAWHSGRHGKKIQNSGIGGIIADLKNKSHTPIEVGKFFPSTQLCPACGQLNKIPLSERVYSCDCGCGFSMDRDTKSALCILEEGLRQNKIPTDRRDFKPVESETSIGSFRNTLAGISGISCKFYSMKQEASEA